MARIQTNVAALNAHRNLANTNLLVQRSIQKLSTGFRINRAADDAAGLSIANKLRADVRAYQQAARNASQAGSVLQISDGALSTLSNIVDRMKELAMQAGSDNVSASQRATLHQEFDALRSEITRIVDTTRFQGSVLLDGSFGSSVNAAGSTLDDVAQVSNIQLNGTQADAGYTFDVATDGNLTVANAAATLQQVVTIAAGAQTVTISLFGISFQTDSAFLNTAAGSQIDGTDLQVDAGTTGSFLVSASGDYSGSDLVTINNIDVRVATLGIDGANGDLQTSATTARTTLTNIDGAITIIAGAIGDLGAAQSRMETALSNVNSIIENLAAAESVIRDADMAFEMTVFTKNQIIQQAGTAMLAQANAAPQGILALLAG